MARRGLNGTFLYTNAANEKHVYKVRVSGFTVGSDQVAQEDANRDGRAFYPRHVFHTMASVQIILKGVNERASFNNFMLDYGKQINDASQSFPPLMTFILPSYQRIFNGIPLAGFSWGNQVGKMVWTPTILIQPVDSLTTASKFNDDYMKDKENLDARYFYPAGPQLSGEQGFNSTWATDKAPAKLKASDVDEIADAQEDKKGPYAPGYDHGVDTSQPGPWAPGVGGNG